jgi:hypothetical protein
MSAPYPPPPAQWPPAPTSPPPPAFPQPAQPQPAQPQPAQPQPAQPQPAQPHPAPPQPTSTYWPQDPFPTSAPPQGWADPGPTSAPPHAHGLAAWDTEPDPDDRSPYPSRIEWSQPARRGKLWLGVLIGALAGVLVAGTGGFLLGRGTAGAADPQPSAAPSLAPYESAVVALNKAKFSGELSTLAEPWLTSMGGCVADTDIGGPPLQPDEQGHVLCRTGGVVIHFASFVSRARTEAARNYRQQLALDGPELAPGIGGPQRRTGGVTGAPGMYVEYALRGEDGRPLCGIWWDRDNGSAAVYTEALCEATLGGRWEPLRDLWARHS